MVMKSHHKKIISFKLLWCVLFASTGMGFVADAASLASYADTISSSAPSAIASHKIEMLDTVSLNTNDYIEVVFAPEFLLSGNIADAICPLDTTASSPTTHAIRCTATAGVAVATTSITIGQVINPSLVGNYAVTTSVYLNTGNLLEWSQTWVAINDSVTVGASVLPRLGFVILPLETDIVVNGATTTIPSATSSINFGNLNFSATTTIASSSIAGQELQVTTNANYGFLVTVEQNQDMTSSNGAIIDPFANGTAQVTASDWVLPLADLNDSKTFGHLGITTDDDTISGAAFGVNKWKGFSGTSTMEVMRHTGPADGLTAGKGLAKVAYQVQVSALQEAGEYTNILTYICTPTY